MLIVDVQVFVCLNYLIIYESLGRPQLMVLSSIGTELGLKSLELDYILVRLSSLRGTKSNGDLLLFH